MLFTQWNAPDRRLPTAEVHAGFDAHPDETLLFDFTTDRMAVGEHEGDFSLKLVTHGRETYRIGRSIVTLSSGQVLLTSAGRSYSRVIETPRTRAISAFLPASVVAGIIPAVMGRADALLDGPSGAEVEVAPVPFRPDPPLAAALAGLIGVIDALRSFPCRLEEVVLHGAARALSQNLSLAPSGAFPVSMRRATREELIGRVLRARDLIEDTGGRVSLAHMADAAGLSRYHFLRVFRSLLGVTPAVYARQVRLARGLARLARGGSTRAAARVAGFASSSTFLRSVRRK